MSPGEIVERASAAADKAGRSDYIIAGAVIGVIGTLLALMGLVSAVDARYVTRKEYEATIVSTDKRLQTIQELALSLRK